MSAVLSFLSAFASDILSVNDTFTLPVYFLLSFLTLTTTLVFCMLDTSSSEISILTYFFYLFS
ncbi:hypothetical protein HYE06_02890 [Mycoplasmopsis bovis]|nr:hypothetical protein HYE27_02870 [Mycoplasmopsis bovis]QUE42445.1 hypothetical protein HYE06_02890 [Mycoplasmopsis bovis]